jgi:folylpolyglutamate synthase
MTSSSIIPTRRSYADAIDLLNSLQSNAAVIDAIRKGGGKGGEEQVAESVEYLRRIGYHVSIPPPSLPVSL